MKHNPAPKLQKSSAGWKKDVTTEGKHREFLAVRKLFCNLTAGVLTQKPLNVANSWNRTPGERKVNFPI